MSIEWQGDHKLLDASGEKQAFELELKRLGLDPDQFLVEVRRELGLPGAGGRHATWYTVYITDLAHPGRETRKLHGGEGENWVEQFAVRRR